MDKEKLYTLRWYLNHSVSATEENKKHMLDLIADLLGEKSEPQRETPAPDESKRIRAAIIVGHEKKAPGAEFNNPKFKSEYDYNSAIARRCVDLAMTKFKEIDLKVIYRDGIGISGAYSEAKKFNPDCCIELHFNAFNEKAFGGETLSTVEQLDKDFSEVIQAMICQVFNREGNSRGVKVLSRGDRGGGNIYSMPGSANCLVEPFFGDNPVEAQLASDHFEQYAVGLMNAFVSFGKKKGLLT